MGASVKVGGNQKSTHDFQYKTIGIVWLGFNGMFMWPNFSPVWNVRMGVGSRKWYQSLFDFFTRRVPFGG